MGHNDKVIVLGMDGLDPNILSTLLKRGEVPSFDRLRREGTWGMLQSAEPAQSPVVWTTLATGTNPGKHGVFDFIHRDPRGPLPFLSVCQSGRGGPLKSTSYVQPRRNAAFWDVLGERGVPVTIVRWPVTYPAESINGRMFSGLGVPSIRGTLGHYTFYTDNPSVAPDVPPDRLMKVEVRNGRAETIVKGPLVRGLVRTSESTVPLRLRWTDNGTALELGRESFELLPGNWSDWVPVQFSLGALKSVSGMVKFYLAQREPDLKLYMSPLEVDPQDPAFHIATPEGYAAELADSMGRFHTLGMPEDTKALNEGALSEQVFVEQCNEITRERLGMFWHEFQRFDAGVFGFVFDTSDRVQHMFWRENRLDGELNVVEPGARIRDHYLLMDQFLGELLDAMDSRTALLIVSDHGFTSFDTCFDLNGWLAAEGFMTLTDDPRGKKDEETGLYRLVDWSRTVAYGCGFSSLYFNLKGREPKGVVDPAEADDLAQRIAQRMAACKDPRTGARPVTRLSRRQDIYHGSEVSDAPDMVLGTAPGYRMSWQTAVGGVCADVLAPNDKHWCGDHIVDHSAVPGTILTNMPLNVADAAVEDIAPTVLALMGLEPMPDCDGRSLVATQEA